ncbi:MAG: hypothetical protein Q3X69_02730 [Alistipes sp.]|nr:hypothetical protein [Alistipes sp.]
MRAKIITCDQSGRKIVSKYSQITPIGKDVYAAFVSKSASGNSESDIYSIVFAVEKVFFSVCYVPRRVIDNEECRAKFIEGRKEWREGVKRAAQDNAYIPLLYVRVFELLGEDTAPLLQARENDMRVRAKRNAENSKRYPFIHQVA